MIDFVTSTKPNRFKIKRVLQTFLATFLLITNSTAFAATLNVGDKAPKLTQGEYVKGEPVKEFKSGTVYVLEFWATWCGPCIRAIPHVSELQKEYGDQVIFIGQNVWENDESKVKPFVDKMGDKMDYRVALDQNDAMSNNWMRAAGRNGIPCSMIVDQNGVIAWIGHPMSMDEPLKQIVAGNFDPKAAAAAASAEQKIQQAFQEKVMPALQEGNFVKASALLKQMAKAYPTKSGELHLMRFGILMQAGETEKGYKAAEEALPHLKDMPDQLNQIAWAIATDANFEGNRNLDVALAFATQAALSTERQNPNILDTLARIHFDQGNKAQAIEIQKEALALEMDDATRKEFQEALNRYEQEKA